MDRPVECRALAVLRESRGAKKNWLAAQLGLAPVTYYEYEKGKLVPSRKLLERAAVALGLPAHQVDRTLEYLRRADAEVKPQGSAGPEEETDPELERLAAALGLEWEDLLLAVFRRGKRLARAIAEREKARVHFPRLREYPAAERLAVVRENKLYQTWAVGELAAHESIEAAADDPDEALAWAELAVLIADLAPGEEAFRRRFQGYAGLHRANAIRVKGRLLGADEEVRRAKALWEAGAAGDPDKLLDEARVLGMEASLRREQRRLPEARDLLDRAIAADRGGLRTHLLINQAKIQEELGEFEPALETLRRALALIGEQGEPRLFWNVRFNILVNLCSLGRYGTAAEEFDAVKVLTLRLGTRIGGVRLEWLRGWIMAGLGRLADAEAAFDRARREFLALDIPYDAALASLELAVLYLKQGRADEVRELCQELAPVFESQQVTREAMATLLLFREAVEQETLTLETAQRFLEDFRRARCCEASWS